MVRRATARAAIPGVLYQRGKILTWPVAQKKALVDDLGIDLIVNFWSRVDPDLHDMVRGYLHFPLVPAKLALENRIQELAQYVGGRLRDGDRALILCEAGVTRSVYFTALLVREHLGLSGLGAVEFLEGAGFSTKRLRPEMHEHLRQLGPVASSGHELESLL